MAKTPFGFIAGKYGTGFNNRMFCAYTGQVDNSILKKFGYDAGFTITHPREFARAIANSIGTELFSFGKCLYHPYKAVLGFPGNTIDRHQLSPKSVEIVNAAKHFIKPIKYSHQKEFRFLWELPSDVFGAVIVDCSSAKQFCKPLYPAGR